MDDNEKLKLEHDRLWNYFSYHAEQRIKTFHLYLIISGLISSGFAVIFAKAGIHAAEKNRSQFPVSADAVKKYYMDNTSHQAPACKPNINLDCYKHELDQVKSIVTNINEKLNSIGETVKPEVDPAIINQLPELVTIMLGLGLLLMFFSWVFKKLDDRNHVLVNTAREQLVLMERIEFFNYPIFSKVEEGDKIYDPLKFRKCLGYIFFVVGFVGLLITIYALRIILTK